MAKALDKTLGVLGGMGPAAAAEFLRILADDAPAENDSGHPRIIFISDPETPDRSDAILGIGPDPTPILKRNLLKLASWGADLLAVPCNTAHHFIDAFRDELPVPLVHIGEATLDAAQRLSPEGAWMLATDGTLACGIYQKEAERRGYTLLLPEPELQTRVQTCLRLVKAGNLTTPETGAGDVMRSIVTRLWEQSPLPVMTACTELPLAYEIAALDPRRQISSLKALAGAVIERLYAKDPEPEP